MLTAMLIVIFAALIFGFGVLRRVVNRERRLNEREMHYSVWVWRGIRPVRLSFTHHTLAAAIDHAQRNKEDLRWWRLFRNFLAWLRHDRVPR